MSARRYEVFTANNLTDLEAVVSAWIAEGGQAAGGVAVVWVPDKGLIYHQALVFPGPKAGSG